MGEMDLTADGSVLGLVGCKIGETKGLSQVRHDHCSFSQLTASADSQSSQSNPPLHPSQANAGPQGTHREDSEYS